MKKHLILTVTLVVSTINLITAQQWLWVKPAGGTAWDYAYAVATDLSGNVFVTGSYENTGTFGTTQLTNSGQKDVFIVKYNNQGTVQWVKKAGGTGVEEGKGIVVDDNGDCYVTGYFTGNISFGTTNFTSANGKDIFIAKYNGSNGNLSWAKQISVTGDAEGERIALDNEGNIYVTGYFRNTATFKPNPGAITLTATGGLDAFVAKYNASGTCLWAKKGGGASLDRAYGLAVTESDVVVTGYYEGTGTFGTTSLTSAGSGDAFTMKYDTAGNFKWAKSFGGSNSDWGQAITTDTAGNVFVTGRFEIQAAFQSENLTSNGSYDIFLAKLNSSGNLQWVKNYGGLYLDYTNSIVMNKYYDALYFTGAYAVEAYFGTDTLNSATASQDVFVAKTDTSGNLLWVADGGGLYDDQGNSVAVDTFGVVYVAGSFYNNTTSFGSVTVSGYVEYDAFIAKICPLSAQYIKTNVTCHGGSNGSAIIIPDGGTPPFSYTWSPNVSTNDTVENLVAGTYNITVEDNNGCAATIQLTIQEPAAMTLATSVHHITCNNANNGYASVSVSGGTPAYSYLWNTVPPQANDTAFNLSQGSYKVVVTDANGCKDSTLVNIINPPVLQANAGQNTSVCSGNNVTLGGFPVATGGTPGYTYNWAPPTFLNNPTATNPVATPTYAITYTLTVTDVMGCVATSTVSISITQPPQVVISQTDTICVGQNTNLAANASNALSYTWAPASSLSNANIQTPVASPTVSTTYIVTVTFAGNCYNTASVPIIVNPLPQINTGGNPELCEGDSVQLSATGGQAYIWQPSGLLYDNTVSNPQTYPLWQDISFTVTVTNQYQCSSTASINVTVHNIPTPTIIENNGTLTSNYAVGNQWYLDGNIINGATGQNYTPVQNGSYTVAITLNNCTGTSAPYSMVNVGIVPLYGSSLFKVFPNPAHETVNLIYRLEDASTVQIYIKDVCGRQVAMATSSSASALVPLDLSHCRPGVYFVELHTSGSVSYNIFILFLY